jgi:predicted metal-dependent enzyme (double-stranded beta helix superfamily)
MFKSLQELNKSIQNQDLESLYLKNVIKEYKGTDWQSYNHFSLEPKEKSEYSRNLVYSGARYDIYIMCWQEGQESKIHDHPNDGCIMMLLQGAVVETVFNENTQMLYSVERVPNDITFMKGAKRLHKISALENSTSLHIYPKNI